MAQDHYLTINFIAALSGDYDPLIDTTDALMINSMGRYFQNTDRWRFGSNNLIHKGAVSGHLFLAHGRKDKIVPVRHSLDFSDSLSNWNNVDQGWPVYTFFPESFGHDYLFWDEAGLKALNQLRVLHP